MPSQSILDLSAERPAPRSRNPKALLLQPLGTSVAWFAASSAPTGDADRLGGAPESFRMIASRPLRALIVDDSRASRLMIRENLEGLGFEVSEAVNGEDALEQLRIAGPADVALVDWHMPAMDGPEFVVAARQNTRYANMKLMMLTGEADVGNITAVLEAGADEYIIQPFAREALVDKLKTIGLSLSLR